MIPLSECKNRGVYKIDSRNLSYGVFDEKHKGFIGIRYKFGDRYLFTEFHWDTGAPFGTVMPEKFIEMLPEEIELKEGDRIREEGAPIDTFVTYKPLFEYLDKFPVE